MKNRLARVIQKLKEGRIPETQGVGESQLQEMLDLASSEDPTQLAYVRKLYDAYSRITGKKFDENLFEGLR